MSQIFNIGLSFLFMNSRRIYIICFNTKGTSEDIKVRLWVSASSTYRLGVFPNIFVTYSCKLT